MTNIDVKILFKDIEEPEEFTNIEQIEVNEKGKFLYLAAGSLEWYILHDKILWFEITYKGEPNEK